MASRVPCRVADHFSAFHNRTFTSARLCTSSPLWDVPGAPAAWLWPGWWRALLSPVRPRAETAGRSRARFTGTGGLPVPRSGQWARLSCLCVGPVSAGSGGGFWKKHNCLSTTARTDVSRANGEKSTVSQGELCDGPGSSRLERSPGMGRVVTHRVCPPLTWALGGGLVWKEGLCSGGQVVMQEGSQTHVLGARGAGRGGSDVRVAPPPRVQEAGGSPCPWGARAALSSALGSLVGSRRGRSPGRRGRPSSGLRGISSSSLAPPLLPPFLPHFGWCPAAPAFQGAPAPVLPARVPAHGTTGLVHLKHTQGACLGVCPLWLTDAWAQEPGSALERSCLGRGGRPDCPATSPCLAPPLGVKEGTEGLLAEGSHGTGSQGHRHGHPSALGSVSHLSGRRRGRGREVAWASCPEAGLLCSRRPWRLWADGPVARPEIPLLLPVAPRGPSSAGTDEQRGAGRRASGPCECCSFCPMSGRLGPWGHRREGCPGRVPEVEPGACPARNDE